MIIKIKNLRLRTTIGLHEWERQKQQEIIINLELEIDSQTAAHTDNIADSVDYQSIKNKLLEKVEKSNFFLIERLAGFILDIVMENKKISRAKVEIDKPHALRFAESVSITLERTRNKNAGT